MGDSDWRPFIYGGLASIIAEFGTFPIDTTKTRLQIQGQKLDPRHVELRYSGMVDCFVKTSRQEGVKALYCGIWPAVLRQATYGTIKFGTYYSLKETIGRYRADGGTEEHVPTNTACAAFAGGLSSAIANPTDVLKVRMQCDACAAGRRGEARTGAVLRVDTSRGGVAGAVAGGGAHLAARGAHRGRGAARVRRSQATTAARAGGRARQPSRGQRAGQPRQCRGQHAARRGADAADEPKKSERTSAVAQRPAVQGHRRLFHADGPQRRPPGAVQGVRPHVAAHGTLEHHLLPHVRAAQTPALSSPGTSLSETHVGYL